MKRWERFEDLVGRIHDALGRGAYSVDRDVIVSEPSGGSHQIDVRLRPTNPFSPPILVSCKSGGAPVGADHVREWSDIVQQTGAAAGIIVSPAGYTAGAVNLAGKPERRVSLWVPRLLTAADFGPTRESPMGLVQAVRITSKIYSPRVRPETFKLDVAALEGPLGREFTFEFSAVRRSDWYLRDDADNVVGNAWDDFVAAVEQVRERGEVRIAPEFPRFIVFEGYRLRFNALHVVVELDCTEIEHGFDLTLDAFGYENAVTGKVAWVPLPARILEGALQRDPP